MKEGVFFYVRQLNKCLRWLDHFIFFYKAISKRLLDWESDNSFSIKSAKIQSISPFWNCELYPQAVKSYRWFVLYFRNWLLSWDNSPGYLSYRLRVYQMTTVVIHINKGVSWCEYTIYSCSQCKWNNFTEIGWIFYFFRSDEASESIS